MITFPCEQCGACCRAVCCELLTEDNLCSVYQDRPTICNVNSMVNNRGIEDVETWYNYLKVCCKALRDMEV